MNSSYDNSLTKYADGMAISYKLISDLSYCTENINTHFIKSLLDNRRCRNDDVVIYMGDSLTNNGYEFCLNDLLKIIPFIVREIPQHHYVLFKDFKKIIYISFENEIKFGVIN